MISRLRGKLLEKQPPFLIIDVQGVGYEVEAPMSTFYTLPDINQETHLFTHLSIREDAHILFGFATETERQLFRYLIKINGIGPKLALSILSTMEFETFVQCVQHNHVSQLTRIPGVGKKTAERLIIEMRDKLSSTTLTTHETATEKRIPHLTQGLLSPIDDAVSALVALGYKVQEASRWVNSVAQEMPDATSEALIRKSLQTILKK